MRLSILAASLLATSSALTAQLAITEVIFDPVGPDLGNETVEIQNISGAPFTPTGWQLCVPFVYGALPSISIPAGGVVTLHLGTAGTNSVTDFFLPSFASRQLSNSDEIQLYKSNLFFQDADIVDAVSWGGTLRMQQAVNIGQWGSVSDLVSGPFFEGQSIAWAGSGDDASAWYRDSSPTMGAANGTDSVSLFGTACATSSGTPGMTIPSPAVSGNQDFAFRITGGPAVAPAAVFVGTPSGGLPVFGCSLEVLSFTTIPGFLGSTGTTDLGLPLSSAAGISLSFQTFILDAAAPNGLFGATNAATITFGA